MEFRRNPRLYLPEKPVTLQIKKLPVTPTKTKRPIWTVAIYPIFMVLTYGLLFLLNVTTAVAMLLPLCMLIPMILTPIVDRKYNWKESWDNYKEELKNYNTYLDILEDELKSKSEQLGFWTELDYPSENTIINRCYNLDKTLWCKRAEHTDFPSIHLGNYKARFPIQFSVEDEDLRACKDKNTVNRLISILDKYEFIENYPMILNLNSHPCVGIRTNSKIETEEIVAGILLSSIYSYGYDEYKIMAVVNEELSNISLAESNYQWIRWLPHCWDDDKKIRYMAATSQEKSQLLDILESICKKRSEINKEDKILPHITVLIEDIKSFEQHQVRKYFKESKNKLGISLIFISDNKDLPSQCESILTLKDSNSASFSNTELFGLNVKSLKPNKIGIYEIERVSRFMSTIQLTDDNISSDLPESITLFDTQGEKKLTASSIVSNWSSNLCYRTGILVDMGYKSRSNILTLDMSDEEDGAHMLVAGTTGSGKSEALQTFVVSLAMRYNPNEVSFVFIDFKEGGMSEAFRNLPHNSGILTNMEGETQYFAARAIKMLNNERKRRAKLLQPYGQKISAYHKAYHESPNKYSMDPLPHLFIIVDEFAEVIQDCLEFKEMIISLSRVGRSLGIHLVLATQSPSQSVDTQIWSNSNTKICLQVLNVEESSAVIKTKDAANITNKGRAYALTSSHSNLIEFQTSWSGAPTNKDILDTNIVMLDGVANRTVMTLAEKVKYSEYTQLNVVMDLINQVWEDKEKWSNNRWVDPHTVLNPSIPIIFL